MNFLPNTNCILFLEKNAFVRNISIEKFRMENNSIDITKYFIYCVGIIDGIRIVHPIQILAKTPHDGVISYKIRWWNNATHILPVKYMEFWIYSGVTLRKNFFLYQDKMSFLKSSFIYDFESKIYYRLQNLLNYLIIPEINPYAIPIYSLPTSSYKYYKFKKHKQKKLNKRYLELQTSCKKFLKKQNEFDYLKINFSLLYEELSKIISNKNGYTTK